MKTRIEINSGESDLSLNLREIWDYKFLMVLFIRRDFVAKYKQNVLGPIWFILQPVLMTLVFTVIFGGIAKIPTDGIPPMLFYLSGLTMWNFFSLGFTANASILVSQSALYSKVYFPRMSLPIANVIANLMAFSVQMLLFLCFVGYYVLVLDLGHLIGMKWSALLLPVCLGISGCLSLGFGLWMSSLTAKYRDLVQLAAFFVQLGMYVTPVIYPLSGVPERLAPWIRLNPLTSVIETFRHGFLGQGHFSWGLLGYSAIVSLLVMFSGMALFQRVQRSFVDSV